MKKLLIPIIAVLVLGALLVIALVKQVPEGHVAIKLDDPGATPLVAGERYTGGGYFVVPNGVFERRYPPDGSINAFSEDGTQVSVVVLFRLGIRDPFVLHGALGAAFEEEIADVVRDAVEIDVAGRVLSPGSPIPDDFPNAIALEVKSALDSTGIGVAQIKIEEFVVGKPGAPIVATVTPAPIRKIIFVGADGADWMLIDRLMAAGRLPNFKRIVDGGATGVLQSMEPMLSPLLWTTMATGKMPEDHGILNFTVFDKETGKRSPITRMSRKVDAFWNMLGDYDRSVSILGWLATFPAEDINGVMVTDRVGYLAFADASDEDVPDNAISPASRVDELAALVVNGPTVAYDDFKRFIAMDEAEFLKARSVDFDPKDPVNNMIMLYATAESFRAMSNHLLDRDASDFLAVYYELIDATGHLFMNYAAPQREDIDDRDYARYSAAVDEAYVMQDEILGEMLGRLDDDTILMVVSDHGWKSEDLRPLVSPQIWGADAVRWHRQRGVVLFYGNGVRSGQRMEDYDLADVAPTILALQGFPAVTDMPGRIMTAAFDDSVQSRFNTSTIATLERDRGDDATLAAAEAGDAEALKKLEALGYITPENPYSHNNLGQRYLDEGRIDEAIAEFDKALALQPDFVSALNNLGAAYGRTKQYDKADEVLRRVIEINPSNLYAINNLAVMNAELRRLDVALEWAQRAVDLEPTYANAHVTLGSIQAQMQRLEVAEQSFVRALELDPDNKQAKANLERVRQARAQGGQ